MYESRARPHAGGTALEAGMSSITHGPWRSRMAAGGNGWVAHTGPGSTGAKRASALISSGAQFLT